MADIELVIKIPEEIYDRYMNYTEGYVDFMFFGTEEKIVRAIRNGKSLPKCHGRLIDADAVLVEPFGNTYKDISIAETIIEADKAESEG